MSKIITLQEIDYIADSLSKSGKTSVLCGGCFDIVHIGHIKFLETAKKEGDILLLLLESDEKVRLLKGKNRPYFAQKERAKVLSSLKFVDYVILLPYLKSDREYMKIVKKIKPKTIVATENDPLIGKKSHQAESVGGKFKIIPYVKTFSSSKLAKILGIE